MGQKEKLTMQTLSVNIRMQIMWNLEWIYECILYVQSLIKMDQLPMKINEQTCCILCIQVVYLTLFLGTWAGSKIICKRLQAVAQKRSGWCERDSAWPEVDGS